jgi:hypothetical protein
MLNTGNPLLNDGKSLLNGDNDLLNSEKHYLNFLKPHPLFTIHNCIFRFCFKFEQPVSSL